MCLGCVFLGVCHVLPRYYLHTPTGESFWAVGEDDEWMEVLDEDSQCYFHRHATTGDTRWPEDSVPRTVWEELKDPITGQHYYYSNSSLSSQWHPPLWLDYVDPATGEVYYFNSETNESTWDRPANFEERAVSLRSDGLMQHSLARERERG